MTATEKKLGALQRGRSEIDFLGAVSSYANGELRERFRKRYEEAAAGAEIPQSFPERLTAVQAIADPMVEWQFEQLYARVVAEELQPAAAFAGIERHGAEPTSEEAPSLVPVNPNTEIPDWWDGVNYHIAPHHTETPKWTFRSDFSIIPKVFNRAGVAAVVKGSDTFAQRKLAVDQATLEVDEVHKILDVGAAGGGAFMNLLAERYVNAEVHGIDMNAKGLSATLLMGRAQGREFVVSQQNGEHIQYDDDTFDLVTSYAMIHECSAEALRNVFAEILRVLRPGGQMVMVDVPPYRAMDDFQFLHYDWETEGRVEPFWREQCLLDRGALATELGFEPVEEYGLSDNGFPWVIRASKPKA